MTNEISAICGIEILGRYKPIMIDTWNPNIDSKKQLKAVHLERARKYERRARRELSLIYESASQTFPFGIWMRLVAGYRDAKGNAK